MRRAPVVAVALAIATLTAPALTVAGQTPEPPDRNDRPTHPECDPHPPIEITENRGPNGFALAHVPTTGVAVPRPGSGVVAGNGSAGNPYVIEDWCIQHQLPEADASPEETTDAIRIANTDAHVLVRDVVIETALAQGSTVDRGIVIENAANVALVGNRVDDTTEVSVADQRLARLDGNLGQVGPAGIVVEGSEDVNLEDNRVDGQFVDAVSVDASEDVGLTSNTLPGPFFRSGARITDSAQVTLEDNEVQEAALAGVIVRQSPEVALADNRIQDNTGGVLGLNSAQLILENNRLGNTFYAATLAGTPDALVTRNEMSGNSAVGLALNAASGTTVEANNLTNNGLGVRVEVGQGYEVHRNNIQGNGDVGLRAVDVDAAVDAADNWWGCSDGPTDPACDGVEGDVTFDPFLTQPNTQAGAG